jgi:hypothetical protein
MANQPLLAELLLRRKELALKVDQLHSIRRDELFQQRVVRKNVTEQVDDVVATVPLLSAAQVTAEYDFYAKQLRLIDAAIQNANWNTRIDIDPAKVMADYVPPTMVRPEAQRIAANQVTPSVALTAGS